MKEGALVMLRLQTDYGYSNTWWRVMFVDNDKTFIGKLERLHWHEYKAHIKGDCERFNTDQIKQTYQTNSYLDCTNHYNLFYNLPI